MLFAGTVSILGLLQKLWWRMSLSERLTRFFYKTHSFTQIMSSTLVTCLPIPQIMRVPIQWSSFQQERNSIVIKWESETTNILGFRVIYRCPLFWTRKHRWSRLDVLHSGWSRFVPDSLERHNSSKAHPWLRVSASSRSRTFRTTSASSSVWSVLRRWSHPIILSSSQHFWILHLDHLDQ